MGVGGGGLLADIKVVNFGNTGRHLFSEAVSVKEVFDVEKPQSYSVS